MKTLTKVLVLLLLLNLTGCPARRASSVSQSNRIRVGMVTFPGYAPLYLAKEKGLFKGVQVDLLRIESISDLRAAMKSGRIDIYLATYDIFQSAANEVPPGIAFLAIDESHGADGVAAAPGINSIADLKGKPVAAEPGFPPYFVLQYALHKANLTLKSVQFKDMASQDAGTAFAVGRFLAVGTYEPYLSKAIKERNGSRLLVSSRDLPNLIVDFAFASDDLLVNRPKLLRQFADGWFEALRYIEANADDSMSIMARAFKVTPSEMREFQSVVTWLDLNRNRSLFDKRAANNAFSTYDLVGEILDSNGGRQVKTTSDQKLHDTIISSYGS